MCLPFFFIVLSSIAHTVGEIAVNRSRCEARGEAGRTPEAKSPVWGAGVRFGDTPETVKPSYRAL